MHDYFYKSIFIKLHIGRVKLTTIALVPKTYTATFTFAGNGIYLKSTKSVNVVVKKAIPKLTAKSKTFKSTVKTKVYMVYLKTNTNKAMKNVKVSLLVNKKTFVVRTNSKGIAVFKMTHLTKQARYTAIIKYAGISCYYSKVARVRLTVV